MRFLAVSVILTSLVLLGVQGRVLFPEELVSFFSFVYSIFPPVKVGQDSRIGAGFRVGQNADFQVLLELGPQSETRAIGPDASNARETRENSNIELKYGNKRSKKKIKEYKKFQFSVPTKKITKMNTVKN